jgi:hypothetical protein
MGITFGDSAEVKVGGDMVGGDQIITDGAWNSVASVIADGDGALPQKTDAMQALSALRLEMAEEEPDPVKAGRFVETIRLLAPGAITALVTAVPKILEVLPALVAP